MDMMTTPPFHVSAFNIFCIFHKYKVVDLSCLRSISHVGGQPYEVFFDPKPHHGT